MEIFALVRVPMKIIEKKIINKPLSASYGSQLMRFFFIGIRPNGLFLEIIKKKGIIVWPIFWDD